MARTEYQQFVSDFAKANPGPDLMKRAAAAWRASGHAVAARKPKSACVGKKEPNCLPPCKWNKATAKKRAHCRSPPAGKTGVAKKQPATKRGPRAKLSPAYHSCAGLTQDPCDVAPNCYWQPTKKRCATRSGKQVKQRMQGADRAAMMAQIRGQQTGGYWW